MSNDTKLGKIQSCRHGFGGYQDAMFGYTFTLGGDGWGVGDFWGTWADRPDYSKWTDKDQADIFAANAARVRDLLKAAKVSSFSNLEGVPVEIQFEDMRLKSWRILTEVL